MGIEQLVRRETMIGELFILLLLLSVFTGYSKNNERGIVDNDNSVQKPQIYDIKAYPGNECIKFTWKVDASSNKSAKKTVIYWNKMNNSLQVPLTLKPSSTITDSVVINNLSEGTHSFTFAAEGSAGTASTRVSKRAKAYGPHYQKSLKNRKVDYVYYKKKEKTVYIVWGQAKKGEVTTKLTYKNDTGKIEHILVTPSANTTMYIVFCKSPIMIG